MSKFIASSLYEMAQVVRAENRRPVAEKRDLNGAANVMAQSMIKHCTMHFVAGAALLMLVSAAGAAPEPLGEWVVEKGVARIKIDNCGGTLWGVVAWEQTPGRDKNNPDPSKRDRPTLGLPILLDMKPVAEGKWEGEVYNAEDGQKYSSSIQLRAGDTLRIEGCVLRFLCGGETWTRYAGTAARGIEVCSSVGRPTGPSHQRRLK